MVKKIQRTCSQTEEDNAAEIQKLTNELRKAQTKHTLAKLYEKVLDYGSELVLRDPKCVDNSWMRNEVQEDPLLGEASKLIEPKRHDPEETLRKNAQFLIESSRKLPDYVPKILSGMENAYRRHDYQTVIELAVQHDSNHRRKKIKFEREPDKGKSKEQIQNEVDEVHKTLSITCNWGALLDEILAEKPLEKTALGHCVSALRSLFGELTYDARSAAKESLTRAIAMLEDES